MQEQPPESVEPVPAAMPYASGGVESDPQARQWAMFCHLAGLAGYIGIPFGNVIGPLIFWLIKRHEMPFVDAQGKEAVNFQISVLIYTLISIVLILVVIGFVLLAAVWIFSLVVLIMAAVKANAGEPYRYPLSIRFIK